MARFFNDIYLFMTLSDLDVLCQELVQKMDTEPKKETNKNFIKAKNPNHLIRVFLLNLYNGYFKNICAF